MPQDREAQPDLDIRLVTARSDDVEAIAAAIQLGNLARSTIGHMPHAAYHQAAENGTLLLAYHGERVVGYALYALALGRVRLSHLCVDPGLRKRGVARQLVEWISKEHSNYLGILARCRRDYGLGRMWAKLGFAQRLEHPGRSKKGHPVVDWWRDHGHPNLFTPDPDSVLVRAAVDLNVLRDLAEPERTDSEESRALQAEQLVGLLELARTAALNIEIDDMKGKLRDKCTRQAQRLTGVHSIPTKVAEVTDALLAGARQVDPTYPATDQDRLDVRHVAEAIASGLNVFITRDERLTRILAAAAQGRGLRIMRPADVVIHIDELTHAEAYRPAELLNTGYTRQLIGTGQDLDKDILPLVNTASGERPRQLFRTLRDLALAGHERMAIHSPEGSLAAAVSVRAAAGALEVPLLRVASGALADTLARQLLFYLRRRAVDAARHVLRITDPYLPWPLRQAALNDGFQTVDGDLFAFVLAAVGTALDTDHQAAVAARRAGLPEPPSLSSSMPAVVAAEIERVWWPAKVIDSQLPTYVIPIRQAFSSNLLGVPASLLPRSGVLGLSREHVYYRSPGGTQLEPPARLLWYMSEGGSSVPTAAAIVACSQLDAVVTGTPDELYSRFQHLGVWDIRTIRDTARNGQAQALRFTNTEIFPTRIPRSRFQQLARTHGAAGQPPQGPLPITVALFADIYKEGQAK